MFLKKVEQQVSNLLLSSLSMPEEHFEKADFGVFSSANIGKYIDSSPYVQYEKQGEVNELIKGVPRQVLENPDSFFNFNEEYRGEIVENINWETQDPSWWDKFFANAMITGRDRTLMGSAVTFIEKNIKTFNKELDTPLTSYDYQHSEYYRPGLRYYDGMTKIQALLLSNDYDYREYWKKMASIDPSVSAEIFGTGVGFGSDFLMGMGISKFNKAFQISKLVPGAVKGIPVLGEAVTGGLHATAFVTATAPFAKYNKETFGDVYNWGNFSEELLAGALLGGGVGAVSGSFNWFANLSLEAKQNTIRGIRSLGNSISNIADRFEYPRILTQSQRESFINFIDNSASLGKIKTVLNKEADTFFSVIDELKLSKDTKNLLLEKKNRFLEYAKTLTDYENIKNFISQEKETFFDIIKNDKDIEKIKKAFSKGKDYFNETLSQFDSIDRIKEVLKNEFDTFFTKENELLSAREIEDPYANVENVIKNRLEEVQQQDYIAKSNELSMDENYSESVRSETKKNLEDYNSFKELTNDEKLLDEMSLCII